MFLEAKTESSYLDGASQTWYIVHKTALVLKMREEFTNGNTSL